MKPTFKIPEGDRFADITKFRRLGEGGGDVLYECWGSAVRAIQEEAYRAGMAAAVPAGWKPVPLMPTEEMFKASIYRSDDPGDEGAINNWEAMLAAAPKPEKST